MTSEESNIESPLLLDLDVSALLLMLSLLEWRAARGSAKCGERGACPLIFIIIMFSKIATSGERSEKLCDMMSGFI